MENFTEENTIATCNVCSRLREDERGWYCAFNGDLKSVDDTCNCFKETETDPKYLGNYA